MADSKIKVTATPLFKQLRNKVLNLPKKDYRALQAGKPVEISGAMFGRYPGYFTEYKNKDVDNGSIRKRI